MPAPADPTPSEIAARAAQIRLEREAARAAKSRGRRAIGRCGGEDGCGRRPARWRGGVGEDGGRGEFMNPHDIRATIRAIAAWTPPPGIAVEAYARRGAVRVGLATADGLASSVMGPFREMKGRAEWAEILDNAAASLLALAEVTATDEWAAIEAKFDAIFGGPPIDLGPLGVWTAKITEMDGPPRTDLPKASGEFTLRLGPGHVLDVDDMGGE